MASKSATSASSSIELLEGRVGIGRERLEGEGGFAVPAQPQEAFASDQASALVLEADVALMAATEAARTERRQPRAHGGGVGQMELDFGFNRDPCRGPWRHDMQTHATL